MYKFQSKQNILGGFNMPAGMELNPNNRWVKLAKTLDWEELEVKYANVFDGKNGNVAYPLRLALGSLIIKSILKCSDEELVHQIQENPYLQYFCGMPGYKDEPPFDQCTPTRFRKRFSESMLSEINEMVIEKSLNRNKTTKKSSPNNQKPKTDDDSSSESQATKSSESQTTEPPRNKGVLKIDSTCVPQNIRYPLDLSLLNESREKLEKMIDELHRVVGGEKPRTYRRVARREYLSIARKKKKTAKEIRKAIGKQLSFVERDINYIKGYLNLDIKLSCNQNILFNTICKLFQQQHEMYAKRIPSIASRIVSLRQPWLRPIVRGKVKAKVEFGAKIDVSAYKGFVRLEHTSFNAYNEGEYFQNHVERFFEREGHYPSKILTDQIYRTRENILYCTERNIKLLGNPLGRPKKYTRKEKLQMRKAEIDRIDIERKIGLVKGSYGLGLNKAKLKNTSYTTISLAIVAMNMVFASRILFTLLQNCIKLIFQAKFEEICDEWSEIIILNLCFEQ